MLLKRNSLSNGISDYKENNNKNSLTSLKARGGQFILGKKNPRVESEQIGLVTNNTGSINATKSNISTPAGVWVTSVPERSNVLHKTERQPNRRRFKKCSFNHQPEVLVKLKEANKIGIHLASQPLNEANAICHIHTLWLMQRGQVWYEKKKQLSSIS